MIRPVSGFVASRASMSWASFRNSPMSILPSGRSSYAARRCATPSDDVSIPMWLSAERSSW